MHQLSEFRAARKPSSAPLRPGGQGAWRNKQTVYFSAFIRYIPFQVKSGACETLSQMGVMAPDGQAQALHPCGREGGLRG